MLGFRRRKKLEPQPAGPAVRKNQIFAYWDGERERAADPLDIWQGLMFHPEFEIENALQQVDLGDPDAQNVTAKAV